MNEELTRQIVAELARHHNRNDIIQMVCEKAGLDWPQAEQWVKQVETDQAHTIARKQGPLLIFLSVGTLLIGAAMLAYSAEFFLAFFQGQPLDMLLSLRSGYYRLTGALTGAGMIVGGLIGIYRTFLRYVET